MPVMQTARMRFHTQTGGVTLQAQQPLNNVVRVTVQALAAVLGGTQSLHTNGYDEALALPSQEPRRWPFARSRFWDMKSGLPAVVDPLAGSYYVESLTDAIETGALELIGRVDELGGSARAIERGFFQESIAASAYQLQKAQEDGERVVVGVNRFADDSSPLVISSPDFSTLEQQQKSRLAEIKRSRNASAADSALTELSQVARGEGSLMPVIITAVRARATLGEISDTLRAAWGVYRPS